MDMTGAEWEYQMAALREAATMAVRVARFDGAPGWNAHPRFSFVIVADGEHPPKITIWAEDAAEVLREMGAVPTLST